MTPYAALLDRVRTDAAGPLLTYRDLRTGERMELSAASLANAIAKTAGLLRDELDASPGTVLGVHLPLHWQRVVWLGACAATGCVFADQGTPNEHGILVVDRSGLSLGFAARDTVLVSLAPFGLPEPGDVPPGVTEAAVAMRGHPDTFMPHDPVDTGTPLLSSGDDVLTHGEVMDAASRLLSDRGFRPGDRIAIVDPDSAADVLALAGPLVARSSAVLIAHPDAGDLPATLREEGVIAPAQ